MPWRTGPPQENGADRLSLRRRLLIVTLGVAVVVLLLLFGGGILALWSRQMAARSMNVWSISAAQQWLTRAASFAPDDGNVELMRAVCHRRLGQTDRWREAVESAQRKGAGAARVQHETDLGLIRSGRFPQGAETRLAELVATAASPDDVAGAFLRGYLARGAEDAARMFLEGWEAQRPNDAHVEYLWGVYWQWQGKAERAVTAFEYAVARQPRHEPARTALAKLFESQDRLDRAIDQYLEVATRFPASEAGTVGLARVLRKLGRLGDARATLKVLTSQAEPPIGAMEEMARIALESGDYEEAQRWFGPVDLDPADLDTLAAVATALALAGEAARAEELFRQHAASISASTRQYDLGQRLAIAPHDRQAATELQSLLATSTADPGATPAAPPGRDGVESPATSGPGLYALYCNACHGADGDGNGRAARHLVPRPRDFRGGRFRLVSTVNGAPTPEDLEAVMSRGTPGTSMRSYEDLGEDERKLLADEVLRLHREGVRETFVRALESEGEEADEEEIRDVVELCTTPGEVVNLPRIGPPDSESIARGEAVYSSLGCGNCHGEDGVGASDIFLFDEKGRPARPRDLVHEPLRGGEDPQSIFLRIVVGMPGSPHPAAGHLEAGSLIDVVQYCRSLGREPKRAITNHQQAILGTCRAYLAAFGDDSHTGR